MHQTLHQGRSSRGSSTERRQGRISHSDTSALVSTLAVLALLVLVAAGGCGRRVEIPNVVGLPYPQALQTLRDVGLVVGTVEFTSVTGVTPSSVVRQSPVPGTKVDQDTRIELTLAGGGTAPVKIPEVIGMTQESATEALLAAGLTVGKIETVNDPEADSGIVVSQNPDASTEVPAGSAVDLEVSRGVVVVPVPSVIGKTQAEAEQLLKDNGLGVKATQVYSDAPAGQVTDQSPAAGSSLNEGAVVTISVSQGALPVAAVPNVVGQSEADATQALQQAGFVAKANQAYSDTAPAGTVVAQTPPGGVFAQTGATVEVTLSHGPPPPDAVEVPDLTGMSQDEATKALEAAGFKVEVLGAYSDTVPEGSVMGQAPSAGLSSPPGATVTIAVSQGPPPTAATQPTTPTT